MPSFNTHLHPAVPPTDHEHHQVIIVGAGPTGLFLGLKLAREGIDVLVLEGERGIMQSPRATTYMPVVLNEFEKVGLLQDVIDGGHINSDGVVFRTPAGKGDKVLARMSLSVVPKGVNKFDYAGIHMGQHQLAAIIQKRAELCPTFGIRFSHRFAGATQDADKVRVCMVTNRGEKWFSADYVVGCDGAGSSVRRSLGIPFEGSTWDDFRFVATNVKYPGFDKYNFPTANMIVDPEDWAVVARTGKPEEGIWRVAFGVRTDVPDDKILEQIPAKFAELLPGTAEERKECELLNASPYWAHQRVAAEYVVGRIILAGDAAHSNNPIGGLGLTTGLMDAAALGTILIRLLVKGDADKSDQLLRRYGDVRRKAFVEYSNPQSMENKLRLHSEDPTVVESRDEFFRALNTKPKETSIMMASQMNEFLDEDFSA